MISSYFTRAISGTENFGDVTKQDQWGHHWNWSWLSFMTPAKAPRLCKLLSLPSSSVLFTGDRNFLLHAEAAKAEGTDSCKVLCFDGKSIGNGSQKEREKCIFFHLISMKQTIAD